MSTHLDRQLSVRLFDLLSGCRLFHLVEIFQGRMSEKKECWHTLRTYANTHLAFQREKTEMQFQSEIPVFAFFLHVPTNTPTQKQQQAITARQPASEKTSERTKTNETKNSHPASRRAWSCPRWDRRAVTDRRRRRRRRGRAQSVQRDRHRKT